MIILGSHYYDGSPWQSVNVSTQTFFLLKFFPQEELEHLAQDSHFGVPLYHKWQAKNICIITRMLLSSNYFTQNTIDSIYLQIFLIYLQIFLTILTRWVLIAGKIFNYYTDKIQTIATRNILCHKVK